MMPELEPKLSQLYGSVKDFIGFVENEAKNAQSIATGETARFVTLEQRARDAKKLFGLL